MGTAWKDPVAEDGRAPTRLAHRSDSGTKTRQKLMSKNDPAERTVRDIRRKTRKQYTAAVFTDLGTAWKDPVAEDVIPAVVEIDSLLGIPHGAMM